MIATIQKWGNSLGVRIPKTLAEHVKVAEGSRVELNAENGRIVVAPQRESKLSIDELVAAITLENLHGETDTGSPLGREVW